jgi:hypothetical protein
VLLLPRNGWDRRGLRLEYSLAVARGGRCKMGRLPSGKYQRFHGHKTTLAENPDNPDSCPIHDAQIFFSFFPPRTTI